MDKTLTWFFYIWGGLVVLLNLIGIAGSALTSPTFSDFVSWLQDTYSPFNLWNWGLNIVLLLPAFGAYAWREKRRKRNFEPSE